MNCKCIIVDDEPIAIRVIANHLEKIPHIQVVAKCQHAMEALEVLQKNTIDLVFLDIQMPQITGIDFLKTLSHPPKVIFTTAYRDYALEAFDLEVVDYLLKPIAFDRFLKAINKYYRQSEGSLATVNNEEGNSVDAFIYVKADRKVLKVYLKDILYIESLKDYVKLHTVQKLIVTKQLISQFEQALPPALFVRTHRSFIVAMDRIEAFTAETIELNGQTLPIGRVYKNAVMGALNYKG
ncbi:LytR/AlgR family response regulator transcription factor [Microscilla marina]|uniref:Two-component system response regulator protein n=1 Tax=Microscilla marina ATCC 23134 TaxID=313606 RepID=A1ZHU8_MICM2|nr:LytTR family DNA-binding domain-containing protein [Microscilla marina]EAY30105.1 two-component system response regulator protein [Microscilla marina ATCC 23134]